MAHNLESMAYVGKVPWHGLGYPLENAVSPEEMLIAAQLDWQVKKEKMYYGHANNLKQVEDYYALVRDSDDKSLGICGKDYIPTQNKSALAFFKKWTEAGHMELETAGSLDGGRQVWALAKLNESFSLCTEDKVEGYLLLSSPHIWGKSLIVKFTPTRVVCQNTLMMAMSEGGQKFAMPHRMEFDGSVMRTAEEALGISVDKLKAFQATAELLAETKCSSQQYFHFLQKLFNPKDDAVDPEGILTIGDLSRNAYSVALALNSQPGAHMKSAEGTFWGALNSLTYWVDHQSGNARDTALTSAWFGAKARLKEQGLALAKTMAEAVA